jgi:hypothetical protein
LIYYPIGAVGVVFFFIQADADRNIYLNELRLQEQSEQLRRVLESRPAGYRQSDAFLVDPLLETLSVYIRLANACRGSHSVDANCLASVQADKGIKQSLKLIRKVKLDDFGSEEEFLLSYCSNFSTVIQELENQDALGRSMITWMVETFELGFESNFNPYQFDSINAFIESRKSLALSEVDKLFSVLDGAEYQAVKLIRYEQVEIAKTIVQIFIPCFSASENIKNGQLAVWKNDLQEIQLNTSRLEDETHKLRQVNGQIDKVGYFNITIWPFIIILALSLKFAKAAASLKW